MNANTEVMLSIADIADRVRLSPRQINNYRGAAETRLGRKLGQKIGKTWYFNAEEVKEVLKSRELATDKVGTQSASGNFREAVNFSQRNNQAEDSTLTGMEALVAANDQQAITIGRAIGERFTQVVYATAIGTMQNGMLQLVEQFSEMHNAVALPLNHQPALQGSDPNAPQLESYDD